MFNKKNLKANIYEGDEEAKIEIILKNNGNEIWPEDAKLVFDRDSFFSTNEVKLNPQKPGVKAKYHIIFKNLGKYPPKEYKSYLWFYANNEILIGNLTLIIKIEKKKQYNKKDQNLIDKVNEFREIYVLDDKNYTDTFLFQILVKYEFNYGKAFENIHKFIPPE